MLNPNSSFIPSPIQIHSHLHNVILLTCFEYYKFERKLCTRFFFLELQINRDEDDRSSRDRCARTQHRSRLRWDNAKSAIRSYPDPEHAGLSNIDLSRYLYTKESENTQSRQKVKSGQTQLQIWHNHQLTKVKNWLPPGNGESSQHLNMQDFGADGAVKAQ